MISARHPSRTKALLLALLVIVLWGTSWVLIKWGLKEVPPLTFAGLRYMLASLCLLPLVLRRSRFAPLRQLTRMDWLVLGVYGILLFTLTQGALFISLNHLSSVTTGLIFNLTPFFVAFMGIVWLAEVPSPLQWIGVVLNLVGLLVYFLPITDDLGEWPWLLVAFLGMLFNVIAALMGRKINRDWSLSSLHITAISMVVGSVMLLVLGVTLQGIPRLSLASILSIIWLAVVNTALAFTLWNYTQRTLTAMESSIISNLMQIQIVIQAWLILDEKVSWKQVIGMGLVFLGVVLVQLRKVKNEENR